MPIPNIQVFTDDYDPRPAEGQRDQQRINLERQRIKGEAKSAASLADYRKEQVLHDQLDEIETIRRFDPDQAARMWNANPELVRRGGTATFKGLSGTNQVFEMGGQKFYLDPEGKPVQIRQGTAKDRAFGNLSPEDQRRALMTGGKGGGEVIRSQPDAQGTMRDYVIDKTTGERRDVGPSAARGTAKDRAFGNLSPEDQRRALMTGSRGGGEVVRTELDAQGTPTDYVIDKSTGQRRAVGPAAPRGTGLAPAETAAMNQFMAGGRQSLNPQQTEIVNKVLRDPDIGIAAQAIIRDPEFSSWTPAERQERFHAVVDTLNQYRAETRPGGSTRQPTPLPTPTTRLQTWQDWQPGGMIDKTPTPQPRAPAAGGEVYQDPAGNQYRREDPNAPVPPDWTRVQ